MKRFKWTRRGLFGSVITAAAALAFGTGFGAAEERLQPIPEDPAVAAIALEQPRATPLRDKPVVRKEMKGWQEVQQSVGVEFSELREVNGRWESTLRLTNDGSESLSGPVRVVVDDLGVTGATIRNQTGRTPDRTPFIEVLAKGKSLEAGAATAGRRLELAAARMTEDEAKEFSPQYRVLVAVKGEDAAKQEASAVKFTQEQLDRTMSKQMLLDAAIGKLQNKDIYGTATSMDDEGRLQITVYSRIENPPDVPKAYDGIPVKIELSSPIYADREEIQAHATVNTDARFPRPVPIGVGIGNESACSSTGTLGCRTTSGSTKYVMSNYHVIVPASKTAVRVTQPSGCSNVSSNSLGKLSLFYPITFTRTASNRYDAAWASTTTALVGTRPPEGYGKLGSTISPTLGMKVQKYGRTTRFTKGTITAVNGTIFVSYSSGVARFIGTFQVKPQSGYSQYLAPGDSGSLVVKQGTNQPVGLNFAGSGGIGYACPVAGGMLSGARMTIDTN